MILLENIMLGTNKVLYFTKTGPIPFPSASEHSPFGVAFGRLLSFCLPHRKLTYDESPLGYGGSDCQKIAFLPYCTCRGDHWSPADACGNGKPPGRIWNPSLRRRGRRPRRPGKPAAALTLRAGHAPPLQSDPKAGGYPVICRSWQVRRGGS